MQCIHLCAQDKESRRQIEASTSTSVPGDDCGVGDGFTARREQSTAATAAAEERGGHPAATSPAGTGRVNHGHVLLDGDRAQAARPPAQLGPFRREGDRRPDVQPA